VTLPREAARKALLAAPCRAGPRFGFKPPAKSF
jgi:hypothetical protein